MKTKSGNVFLKKNHSKTFNRGVSLSLRAPFSDFLLKREVKRDVFGAYLIISRQYARITAREIEAVRRMLRRLTNRRRDKVLVRVHAFIGLTKKPAQARMGRGKGARSGDSVCYVKPGKILFEIKTTRRFAERGLKSVYLKSKSRISIDTAFIRRRSLLFS